MADKPVALYSRVVVALNGGPCDDRIVRLVVETARPTKAEIVAIHVVEIDWTLPLDANVADRSESAQRVLDSATRRTIRSSHGPPFRATTTRE